MSELSRQEHNDRGQSMMGTMSIECLGKEEESWSNKAFENKRVITSQCCYVITYVIPCSSVRFTRSTSHRSKDHCQDWRIRLQATCNCHAWNIINAMNVESTASFERFVDFVNDWALSSQQLQTITERGVAASDPSLPDLTYTTPMNEVRQCDFWSEKAQPTTKCLHSSTYGTFIRVHKAISATSQGTNQEQKFWKKLGMHLPLQLAYGMSGKPDDLTWLHRMPATWCAKREMDFILEPRQNVWPELRMALVKKSQKLDFWEQRTLEWLLYPSVDIPKTFVQL